MNGACVSNGVAVFRICGGTQLTKMERYNEQECPAMKGRLCGSEGCASHTSRGSKAHKLCDLMKCAEESVSRDKQWGEGGKEESGP